jgi:HEAT repeat protein
VETLALLLILVPPASLAVLYALGAFGVIRRPAGARMRHWKEAARAAGLASVEESRNLLAGWTGNLRVHMSRFEGPRGHGTRISVSGPGIPAGLTVRPEGWGGSVRGFHVREIEVGDEAFDRAAWVEGPPALVRSLLDAGTRRALLALFEGRLERPRLTDFWADGQVEDGELRVDLLEVPPPVKAAFVEIADALAGTGANQDQDAPTEGCIGAFERLPDALAAALALARRLAPPDDVARRLAENLRSEPLAGVRLRCLTALAREFAGHPATRDALLAAREDPDAEVRVRAGIALGPEGRETLLRVAHGEGAPDETTERAVAALGEHLTLADAQEILRDALRTRRERTARACLGAIGFRGGEQAVRTLANVLAVEKGDLGTAAAEGLGETGEASAEVPLVVALASPFAAVRSAAARSLGSVGTTAAVAPLKALEARDSAARVAARQAVAQIQARARGAAPGQLSLAGAESGALSLADGEAGRVSLADEGGRRAPPAGAE